MIRTAKPVEGSQMASGAPSKPACAERSTGS
jgi:hypothetical protein